MDSFLYKRYRVSRGFNYDYLASPPSAGKPTLLFAHGCPSTAYDWRRQVTYFRIRGYGLIVPDMLGYGGTSKPAHPDAYALGLLARDMHEIIVHERCTKVIGVGHDWGSAIISRAATLYHDEACYSGFAFLTAGYIPPSPSFNYEATGDMTRQIVGYETMGQWEFFTADDAPNVAKAHIDSFIDLAWSQDAETWVNHVGPKGAMRAFLEADSRTERLHTISDQEFQQVKQTFMNNGFTGPFNYFKAMTNGINSHDAARIPKNKYRIFKPVLFLGAEKDPICAPQIYLDIMRTNNLTPNLTYKILNGGHWLMFECANEVNTDLHDWIDKLYGVGC